MRARSASLWFALGIIAGSLACGPALTAQPGPGSPGVPPASARSPLGLPRSVVGGSGYSPLLLDRADLEFGTTVQYARIPTLLELDDLRFVPGLAHVVLVLDRWPPEFAPLEALNRLPRETDLIVVLPGYPPSRGAADAWNLLDTRARLVVVADGPPPTGVAHDLNAMRGLERVIVNTDEPSRAGLERLQRPVTFRVVRE